MKKLLLLFVVMLGTIGAYAQSNTTPIKGDVNGDGVVDIADINAVIEIMKNGGGTSGETYYWYVGTTKPTSLSEATVVDSYPAEYTFTNPSMEEKCYVYVLTNSDKTVNMYDPAMPTLPLTIQTDMTTINGYKVTYLGTEDGPARIAKGGSVIIRISDAPTYYWYVGTTKPTSLSQATSVSEYENEVIYTNNSGKKSHIFVLTNNNVTVTFIEPSENSPISQKPVDTTTISGYSIWETAVGVADTKNIKITIQ